VTNPEPIAENGLTIGVVKALLAEMEQINYDAGGPRVDVATRTAWRSKIEAILRPMRIDAYDAGFKFGMRSEERALVLAAKAHIYDYDDPEWEPWRGNRCVDTSYDTCDHSRTGSKCDVCGMTGGRAEP
jgi:hypothetical protein